MPALLHSVEQLEGQLDVYLNRYSRHGNAIYLAILSIALCGLVALPLVHVELTTSAPGMIRPELELQEIFAPVSGFVDRRMVNLGDRVSRGDSLFTLDAAVPRSRLATVVGRLDEIEWIAADLERLLAAEEPATAVMRSPELTSSLQAMLAARGEVRVRLDAAVEREQRIEPLERRGLIPATDFAAVRTETSRIGAEEAALLARYRAEWAERLGALTEEQRSLLTERSALRSTLAEHTVLAPVAGTVEEISSLADRGWTRAGEQLLVISPDRAIHAEAWVGSQAIGNLDEGMPVHVQVDAFDPMRWGYLDGHVARISADAVVVDGRPRFRVDIDITDAELHDSAGRTARIRKGMSVAAHFRLDRRSLLDLARGKAVQRLDPRMARTPSGEA